MAGTSVATAAERARRVSSAKRDALRRRLLFVADLLCLLTAVGAMTLVEGTTDPLYALLPIPLWILLAKAEGLYDADHPKIWHRTTDEASAIFHWITLSVAGSLFFLRALPDETVTVDAAGTMYVVALGGAFVLPGRGPGAVAPPGAGRARARARERAAGRPGDAQARPGARASPGAARARTLRRGSGPDNGRAPRTATRSSRRR